jgi:membrane fusion protein, multidrug efflux system
MRLIVKLVLIAAAAAGIWLLISYQTGGFSEKITADPRAVGPESVDVDTTGTVVVESISVPQVEEAVGTIQSRHRVDISPQIQATIMEVAVNAGDRVNPGGVLVRLDPRDLDAKVGQAEQAVTAATANLRQATADYNRTRELVERKVASVQEGENARLRLDVTSASLGEARRALEQARVGRSYAEMKSPVAGVVIDKRQNAGDTAVPGQPILSVYDPAILRLEAPVRETLATQLRIGETVRVRIGAERQETSGTVDEIVPQAEAATRTFLVKVLIPPAQNLYAGMYGRVLVDTGTEQVNVIPSAAVHRIGQLEYATALDASGKPERRFVQTGRTFGDRVEVLAGLSAGERVRTSAR